MRTVRPLTAVSLENAGSSQRSPHESPDQPISTEALAPSMDIFEAGVVRCPEQIIQMLDWCLPAELTDDPYRQQRGRVLITVAVFWALVILVGIEGG